MLDLNYISNFLAKVEGPCQTTGYIPCHKKGGGTANYRGGPNPELYTAMGSSGVTIATGVDLGQTSVGTLRSYGLDDGIIGIYVPYIGKKRDVAIAYLQRYPLVITPAAAAATDMAVHSGYLKKTVIPTYERASGACFADLPVQAQAVIMSLIYHKGPAGVPRDWPKTWGHLTRQDWRAAATELLTGFTQYVARRKAEGRLLMEIG